MDYVQLFLNIAQAIFIIILIIRLLFVKNINEKFIAQTRKYLDQLKKWKDFGQLVNISQEILEIIVTHRLNDIQMRDLLNYVKTIVGPGGVKN